MKKLIAICLLCTTPALAQPAPMPQQPVDPSKPITLTYGELDRLIKAQIARAVAEQIGQGTEDVVRKINSQIAPPAAEKKTPEKVPEKKAE